MGRIIAIANQKGGVGKTTTSINLSAALSEKGKRVLLIDLDPQGNSTSGLGVDKNEQNTIYHLLVDDLDIRSCIRKNTWRTLDLLPSTVNLAGAEIEMLDIPRHEFILKTKLHEIEDEYDFVIIDCPPRMDSLVRNAFVAATDVIVPVDTGSYSLDGLMQVNATIGMIKRHENPKLRISGLLKVMFDDRTLLSNEMDDALDTIAKKMETQVFGTSIHRSIQVDVASHNHMPLFYYKPKCKVAMDYYDLGMEVAYHVNH